MNERKRENFSGKDACHLVWIKMRKEKKGNIKGKKIIIHCLRF